MIISESALRSIILESLLFEGFKDDQNTLAEMHPEQKDKILSFNEKESRWIDWLTSRFGVNATITDIHPFNEVIESVASFAKVFDSVAAKWKSNEEFRKDVEEFLPGRTWKKLDITPQIIPLLTSSEMETLKGLATREKQHFKINVSEEEMESDRVGKVGSWNLWMPTTRERSCKIAGYDPVTLKPKTTWCTARMAGSNLFYNYIGSTDEDVTLFYIIKDNPDQDNDWLSVGFTDGKPDLEGGDGEKSVNRDNKGLTRKTLKSILGQDYAQIMITLTKKNKSLGGKHPAREQIEAAAKSVEALSALTAGLSKSDAIELIIAVLAEPEISAEVVSKLAQNKEENVRSIIADNPRTPVSVLTTLAGNANNSVRYYVATNPQTPTTVLATLASDVEIPVRIGVAQKPQTPTTVLATLASDVEIPVRLGVASNPQTSPDILLAFATDTDEQIRQAVSYNPQTPPAILLTLAGDEDFDVRRGVAYNPQTPPAILLTLARDLDDYVLWAVAQNLKTPIEALQIIKNNQNSELSSLAKKALADRKKRLNERLLRQLVMQMM